MSGLTKKTVIADRILSTLLGVNEGELVSYAQLSKGLHKYIKDNDLRNPNLKLAAPEVSQPSSPQPAALEPSPALAASTSAVAGTPSKCRDCGADIPAEAVFCDLCGVRQ